MPDGGKMLRYEKVKNATGGVYLSPVFDGNWSDFDRRSAWKSIPDNMSGIPVMKGDNYLDISKGVVSNGPAIVQQQETPLWGQNIIQDHGTVHYQGQMPNQWSQQAPAQKQEGGALPSAAYGMSLKNNYGFPPNMMQGFDNGLAMQQNQPVQLEGTTVSATRGNAMQPAPMHMMNTDYQQPTPQAVDPNQSLDMGSTGMPKQKQKKKGWGFTTPGTGDMVAGAIGIANALMPEEENNSYHVPQFGAYNPNAFGNGSQAIYKSGGKMPDGGYFPGGTHEVKRRVGGFGVTEEIPNMLGKYPIAPSPVPDDITPSIVDSIAKPIIKFEKLDASPGMKGSVWNPVYNGMTPGQIRNAQQFLPSQIAGNEVLRGEAGKDVMSPLDYTPARPLFMDTPQYEPINWHPSWGSNSDWNNGSMQMGGNLSKGQKVKLTASQKAALEKQGYKFQ